MYRESNMKERERKKKWTESPPMFSSLLLLLSLSHSLPLSLALYIRLRPLALPRPLSALAPLSPLTPSHVAEVRVRPAFFAFVFVACLPSSVFCRHAYSPALTGAHSLPRGTLFHRVPQDQHHAAQTRLRYASATAPLTHWPTMLSRGRSVTRRGRQ